VKETWALVHADDDELDDWPARQAIPKQPPGLGWQVWYRAGHPWENDGPEDRGFRWRSPATMPRWASRLSLVNDGVRVERADDGTWEWVVTLRKAGEGTT